MKPHRGTLILVFGILGIVACFPIGIAAWIMGGRDLKEMQAGTMDPSGRGSTSAGRVCGMIGTLLAGIMVVLMLVGGIAFILLRSSPKFRTVTIAEEPTTVALAEPTAVDQAVAIVSEATREPAGNNSLPPAGMALIPAGNFTMGDAMGDGDTDGTPTHTVYVSAYYMDKHEVTKALWDDVYQWATNHGYTFDQPVFGKATKHPVIVTCWYDAVKWCNARSEKGGKTPAYYTDVGLVTIYRTGQLAPHVRWDRGYRLPTEAEWEKAARGGLSGKRFPWGDTITHSNANYISASEYSYDTSTTRGYHPNYQAGGDPHTSPAGSFSTNGYGLYDMAGNVWEWCWDWFGVDGSTSPNDPRGPVSGSYRVLRGGCWDYDAKDSRVACRNYGDPADGDYYVGFRPVLPPGQ
jgi:formylglycine-generating enzyme required for sulfatase activity